MSTAIIKLVRIQCHKLQEEDGDEIYIDYSIEYEGEKPLIDRLPHEKGSTWAFQHNQINDCMEDIFTGNVDANLIFKFKLREQDTLGRLSKTNLMDDLIGEFIITVKTDDQVAWEVGKNCKYKAATEENQHLFIMTGANAEYEVAIYFKLI